MNGMQFYNNNFRTALSDEKHAHINKVDYLIHSFAVYEDKYDTLDYSAPYYFQNGKDISNLSRTKKFR